jgi:hypothetical protein
VAYVAYCIYIYIRFGKKVVDFLEAYVAELVDRPLDLRGLRPVIGVEEHIHGEYVKVYMSVHVSLYMHMYFIHANVFLYMHMNFTHARVYLYMHMYIYTCACVSVCGVQARL